MHRPDWELACLNEKTKQVHSGFEEIITTGELDSRPQASIIICDMIKRNESDVGNTVFEILAKTVFKFLCFILFLALTNPS